MEDRRNTKARDLELARLITAAGRGSRSASCALYDASIRLVYTISVLVLRDASRAERSTANAYEQIFEQAPSYDPAVRSPRAWLVTTAYLQARHRRDGQLDDEPP